MKFEVVERQPGTTQVPSSAPEGDSDDETPPPSNSEEEEEEEHGDVEVDEDGLDFDTAMHQREIALEYYERRNALGSQLVPELLQEAEHEDDDWDQEVSLIFT